MVERTFQSRVPRNAPDILVELTVILGAFGKMILAVTIEHLRHQMLQGANALMRDPLTSQLEREGFQRVANSDHFLPVGFGEQGNREAIILRVDNETFLGEHDERFPHRAATDIHFGGECGFGEGFAGGEAAAEERLTEGVQSGIAHGDRTDFWQSVHSSRIPVGGVKECYSEGGGRVNSRLYTL